MKEDLISKTWLEVRDGDQTYFGRVEDKFTLGTARSNALILKGSKLPALLGQMSQRADKWIYRDFTNRQLTALEEGQSLKVSCLSLRILSFENFWNSNGPAIQKDFRNLLAENPLASKDWILSRLLAMRFLNTELPEEVLLCLRDLESELDLVGPIEKLLEDPEVTDILVESFQSIFVERLGELKKVNLKFSDDETYKVYIQNLLSRSKKVVDDARPFADFLLKNGERAHLVMPPVSPAQPYLSIRKASNLKWNLTDLESRGMFERSDLELIRSLLRQKLNLLISGATGSGKTTLLRALLLEIPASERLVIMEDVPELQIGRENAAYLSTRSDSQSLLPNIELRDLVRQSLRMRPDRLIVGEVRGPEALDLLLALNTGHMGSLGSLHANNARDALWRLHTLVKLSKSDFDEATVRELIHRNIHGIIHCGRDPFGKRRILEIAMVKGVEASCFLLEYLVQASPFEPKKSAESAKVSRWGLKVERAPSRL